MDNCPDYILATRKRYAQMLKINAVHKEIFFFASGGAVSVFRTTFDQSDFAMPADFKQILIIQELCKRNIESDE